MAVDEMTAQSDGDERVLGFIHKFLIYNLSWWSFVLILPGETFGKNPHLYRLFTAVMTEDQWSVYLGIVACIGATGLKWKFMRLISIHAVCLNTLFLSALLFIANLIGTGTGLYAGLSVCGYFLLWRQRHPKVEANV